MAIRKACELVSHASPFFGLLAVVALLRLGLILGLLYGVNGDEAVIEDYDLRWRLNLLSLHRILGISLPGFWSRYPDFDRQVQARGGFAVVLDRGRQGDVRFKKRLDKLGLPYRLQVLEGKVIYTELPAQVYQSPGSRLWRVGL